MTDKQSTRLWPPMSSDEMTAFLHEEHIAILSISRPEAGPVAIPIWYEYREGKFFMSTEITSLHGRHMLRAGRATITVQQERQPYQYVSAEGSVRFLEGSELTELGETVDSASLRIYRRYLSGEEAERFLSQVYPQSPNIRIAVLTPKVTWAASLQTVEEMLADTKS